MPWSRSSPITLCLQPPPGRPSSPHLSSPCAVTIRIVVCWSRTHSSRFVVHSLFLNSRAYTARVTVPQFHVEPALVGYGGCPPSSPSLSQTVEDAHLTGKISFKIGDIVPADCHLSEAINVSIAQAALTGESLPQNKKLGDQCFSCVLLPFFLASSFRLISSLFAAVRPVSRVKPRASSSLPVPTPSLVGQDDDTTGHLQKILA